MGCAGGPKTSTSRSSTLPPPSRTVPPPTPTPPASVPTGTYPIPPLGVPLPTPPAAPPPASPPPGRRGPNASIAILLLAVAVLGVAAALVVTRGGSPTASVPSTGGEPSPSVTDGPRFTQTTPAASPTVTAAPTGPTTTTTVPPTGSTASTPITTGAVTPDPYAQIGTITDRLRQFHEDVVSGDFQAAWSLTSSRYRQFKLDHEGYSTWVTDQQALQSTSRPAGLHATVSNWNAATGVALVDVTGMGWTEPGSSCTAFQGLTWMANDHGAWYYEPGFSLTPQRRAQWAPRATELLGWGC